MVVFLGVENIYIFLSVVYLLLICQLWVRVIKNSDTTSNYYLLKTIDLSVKFQKSPKRISRIEIFSYLTKNDSSQKNTR